ncbi:MAG: 5-formyltetrahydrofolate cyclo-ligase [Beijerinckiaceae bacterium]|nr:5-formyltetrahydrofolate cyclo-ligase [Beijerinckiaceae bacterium]MCZ8298956.1 5-formyltetrahydrofolate cyclo-ligase [Beijerinckiaceae bacterium]
MRKAALAARAAIVVEVRREASARMAQAGPATIAGLAPAARIIAGYVALRDELDPAPLLAALATAGFRLALPRMTASGLAFHAHELGSPLGKGAFGVAEPLPGAPIVAPDVILAPLVAFDRRGNRLGYGKGYYDRAFAAHPEAVRIGLAFAVQEVPAVPDEAHDLPLVAILTETGLIRV